MFYPDFPDTHSFFIIHLSPFTLTSSDDDVWRWECVQDPVTGYTQLPRCKKVHVDDAQNGSTSLNTCKLTCGNSSMLFPKPSGIINVNTKDFQTIPLTTLYIKNIQEQKRFNGVPVCTRRHFDALRKSFYSSKTTHAITLKL